jgi:DedD protein
MEQQLKQRLVGAVVLVSLAVIFIPIILEGPGDEWAPRNQTIPQPPPLDFRTDMELPLPDSEPQTGAGPVTASPAKAQSATAEEDSKDVTAAAPAVVREPEPAAAPAQTVAPKAHRQPASAALADGWYAQVGSFSQQANAAALRERLAKSGYSAHLQQIATGKSSSYRVLVGPEQGRDRAETLLKKLATDQQLKGIVIELPAAAG